MNLESKKVSYSILAIASVITSRLMFVFFDDPEGPNLLVVTVAALIVFAFSWIVYRFVPRIKSSTGLTRLLLTLVAQIVFVGASYLLLR